MALPGATTSRWHSSHISDLTTKRCGAFRTGVTRNLCYIFIDEQQELISKAKETIAAATNKCKDVENKMKVCISYLLLLRRQSMLGYMWVCLRAIYCNYSIQEKLKSGVCVI